MNWRKLFVVLTILVYILGYYWHPLGLLIPGCILLGLSLAIWRGRWFCGHLCPRGMLLDQFFTTWRQNRPIDLRKFSLSLKQTAKKWTWPQKLRLITLTITLGYLSTQIFLLQLPSDAETSQNFAWQYGQLFWKACLLSSLMAVFIAWLVHPRSWCMLCPVGTLSHFLARGKLSKRYVIKSECTGCGSCTAVCPFSFRMDKVNTQIEATIITTVSLPDTELIPATVAPAVSATNNSSFNCTVDNQQDQRGSQLTIDTGNEAISSQPDTNKEIACLYSPDCIHCMACVHNCPKKILYFDD